MIIADKRNTLVALAAALCIATSLTAAQPAPETKSASGYSKQEVVDLINQIAASAPYTPPTLTTFLEQINQDITAPSFEENLEKAISTLLTVKISADQRTLLNQIQAGLLKNLQGYVASGPSFGYNFNGAFFVNTQKPCFTVTYKNAAGNTKTRTYQAAINLIGLNIELALRINAILFVGTDFNFHDSNKTIELGKGVQVNPVWLLSWFSDYFSPVYFRNGFDGSRSAFFRAVQEDRAEDFVREANAHAEQNKLMKALSYLDLTYVPFTNMPGGLVLVAADLNRFPLGFSLNCASLVTGGTLTPVTNAA